MKISRADLLDQLTRRELPVPAIAELPSAAILLALAAIESNFVVDAVGDGGEAVGLWQINKRVNPPWPEGGVNATVPAQIARAAVSLDNVHDQVEWALKDLKERELPLPTVEDVAVWYSIAWQWGVGKLRAWITTSDSHDPLDFLRQPGVAEWYEENAPGGVNYFLKERVGEYAKQLDWALKKMRKAGLADAGLADRSIAGNLKKKVRQLTKLGGKVGTGIAVAQGAGAIIGLVLIFMYLRGGRR